MKALNLTTALLLGSAASFAQVQVDGDMFIGPGVEVHVFEDMTNTGDFDINNTALLHVRGDINMEGTAQQNLGGHVIVDKLHQDNGSGVVVSNGSQVEVYEALELNSGNMTANSPVIMKSLPAWTAYVDNFSGGFGGSYTGDLTMERYVSTSGFHHMGGAVDVSNIATELSEASLYGPNMGQVVPLASCDPDNISPNSPYGKMFQWDENAPFLFNCTQSGWFVRSSGAMESGRGYSLNFNGGGTFDLTGAIHLSTVSTGALGNTNGTGNGFHLVSNPYPSDIEWVGAAGFDGAAYIWQSSGSYAGTYQPTFPGFGTRIASQQAFFVRRSAGSGSFSVPLSARRTGSSAYYRQAANDGLEIIVSGQGFADRTQIDFHEFATAEWEAEVDAMKMDNGNVQPQISSSNGKIDFSHNSLNIDDVEVIPLVFKCGIEGEYTLEFNTDGTDLLLEDKKLGKFRTLGYPYSFVFEEGDSEDRFILHRKSLVQTASETELVSFVFDRTLVINASQDERVNILIFDMAGKLVDSSRENLVPGRNEMSLSELAGGQYIIRINSERTSSSLRALLF